MIQISLEQDTPEWHQFRAQHIGASDAPVIMGDSKYKSRQALWREKMGLGKDAVSSFMQWGKDMEEKARQDFIDEMWIDVVAAVFKIDGTIFSASLDGISQDRKTAVEIKCPGDATHAIALAGDVPPQYVAQLQHQMFVCELPFIYYMSWTTHSYKILKVERDEKYIEVLTQKELEFWEYVKNFECPPRKKK